MSLSTSKSKNQLAYARTVKANTKPKGKNPQGLQSNQQAKSKQNIKDTTCNIYQSIMGEIDSTQQDYIKSLIVRNQRESLKENIKTQQSRALKKGNLSTTIAKQVKKPQQPKKLSLQSHQKTKSQADLLKDISVVNQQNSITQSVIISSEVFIPQEKDIKTMKQTNLVHSIQSTNKTIKQTNLVHSIQSTNPIIQALNNSSSSFAKKIDSFELQYPTQQRQIRNTHKKSGSKLTPCYYNSHVSPKNLFKCEKKQIAVLSQVQVKINNIHQIKKQMTNEVPFIQSLNQYLCSLNNSQISQKPFSNSQQQQTIYPQLKPTKSFSNKQKLQFLIQKQQSKVNDLQIMIQVYKKELNKYKKKERKMKQNQLHMVQCLKNINEELNYEKNQRRKVQAILKDFQRKVRGISRDKAREVSRNNDKYHERDHDDYKDTMQKKYYNQSQVYVIQKSTPQRISKHSRTNSKARFSSTLHPNQPQFHAYQSQYIPNQQFHQRLSLNHSKKINKIISSFQLQQYPQHFEEVKERNSHVYQQKPLGSRQRKNSSGLAMRDKRQMTPKIVEELFRHDHPRNQTRKHQYHHNNSTSEDSQKVYRRTSGNSARYRQQQTDSEQDFNQSTSYQQDQDTSEPQYSTNKHSRYHKDVIIKMR